MRCWNVADGAPLPKLFDGWSGAVRALVFSRDGRSLYGGGEEGRVRCFDLDTGKARTVRQFAETTRALALTPDGGTLVVGPWDEKGATIRLVDPHSGEVRRELVTSSGEYPSLALNRDGTLIAGGGTKLHLKLWETATGKVRTELPGPHGAWVMGTSFSPDGDWLVSADGDPRDHSKPCHLKLWDVKRGVEAAHYDLPRGCFYNVVFAADGRSCYAALHDGTVREYRLPIPAAK